MHQANPNQAIVCDTGLLTKLNLRKRHIMEDAEDFNRVLNGYSLRIIRFVSYIDAIYCTYALISKMMYKTLSLVHVLLGIQFRPIQRHVAIQSSSIQCPVENY